VMWPDGRGTSSRFTIFTHSLRRSESEQSAEVVRMIILCTAEAVTY
jgi:hypothetical protein